MEHVGRTATHFQCNLCVRSIELRGHNGKERKITKIKRLLIKIYHKNYTNAQIVQHNKGVLKIAIQSG